MSVTFSIIPVDEQFIEEDGNQWLHQNDIFLPSEWVRGHRPSFRQIMSSIKTFPEIKIREIKHGCSVLAMSFTFSGDICVFRRSQR